jgi:hypothetical protein
MEEGELVEVRKSLLSETRRERFSVVLLWRGCLGERGERGELRGA